MYEIMTLALYLEGGLVQPVDTEDVAIRANAIAPGKFTWRKLRDQIDLNSILISLRHAKREANGALVDGNASVGWTLTQAGKAFAEKNSHRVGEAHKERSRLNKREEVWARHEKQRLLGEPAFRKFCNGEGDSITQAEALNFFKIDDYVTGKNRVQRISRISNVFESDPDICDSIQFVSGRIGGDGG